MVYLIMTILAVLIVTVVETILYIKCLKKKVLAQHCIIAKESDRNNALREKNLILEHQIQDYNDFRVLELIDYQILDFQNAVRVYGNLGKNGDSILIHKFSYNDEDEHINAKNDAETLKDMLEEKL